jgi:sensor domain CHASE-containing protein
MKTLLIVGIPIISLIIILYALAQIILLGSFVKLEEKYARNDVKRALDALTNEISTLDLKASDWSNWDDTYEFINDVNQHYIRSNLGDDAFPLLRVNLILFINSNGRMVFGKAFDLHNNRGMPVPQSLLEHITPYGLLVRKTDERAVVTGLVLLPEGLMMVTARPILTSENKGPIRGTLVMGRYLDSEKIENTPIPRRIPV